MNHPLEPRVSRLEGVIEQILIRLESIERRLDSFENRVDSKFNWLIGIVCAAWLSIIATILIHK